MRLPLTRKYQVIGNLDGYTASDVRIAGSLPVQHDAKPSRIVGTDHAR
jgi:hypothetical protein